jgi:hypothetical protein
VTTAFEDGQYVEEAQRMMFYVPPCLQACWCIFPDS